MPAAIVAILYGDSGRARPLILSQVILSLQVIYTVANEVRHLSRIPVVLVRVDRDPAQPPRVLRPQ